MKKILSIILSISILAPCFTVFPAVHCSAAGSNFSSLCNKTDSEITPRERYLLNLIISKVNGASNVPAQPSFASSNPFFYMMLLQTVALPIVSWLFKKVYITVNEWIESKKNCGNILETTDPIQTLQYLDNGLSALKGQETAKKQIRSTVLNIVTQKQHRLSSEKNGASVIYMTGPSGVGKTYSAEILTKVLTGSNSKPYIIEASDIDRQSKASPAEQLFGMRTLRVGPWETYEKSPLLTQIKSTPKMVVLINEYDKMHSPELDEKLRTVMDQGYIKVNGETIDCSGVTFIITSNESYNSVHNGNQDNTNEDDGTGSRTFVKHDKAFLNRIKLIEFDNLTVDDYEEIAKLPCKELTFRFLKEYRILLDTQEIPKIIAKKAAELNQGARPIYTFIERLNTKVLNDIILKNRDNRGYTNKAFGVSYDYENDDFVLTEKVLPNVQNSPEHATPALTLAE